MGEREPHGKYSPGKRTKRKPATPAGKLKGALEFFEKFMGLSGDSGKGEVAGPALGAGCLLAAGS